MRYRVLNAKCIINFEVKCFKCVNVIILKVCEHSLFDKMIQDVFQKRIF